MTNLTTTPKPELSTRHDSDLLIALEEAKTWLAKCMTPAEVKEMLDQSAAIAAYLRHRGVETEIQQQAAILKISAECRMGELLREIEREGGKRGGTRYQAVLEENNVHPSTAFRWQIMAIVPEDVREAYFAQAKGLQIEITSKQVYDLASERNEVDVKPDKEPGKTIKFWVTENSQVNVSEQEETILKAVAAALKQCGSEMTAEQLREEKTLPGYALHLLCADYLSGIGEG